MQSLRHANLRTFPPRIRSSRSLSSSWASEISLARDNSAVSRDHRRVDSIVRSSSDCAMLSGWEHQPIWNEELFSRFTIFRKKISFVCIKEIFLTGKMSERWKIINKMVAYSVYVIDSLEYFYYDWLHIVCVWCMINKKRRYIRVEGNLFQNLYFEGLGFNLEKEFFSSSSILTVFNFIFTFISMIFL